MIRLDSSIVPPSLVIIDEMPESREEDSFDEPEYQLGKILGPK